MQIDNYYNLETQIQKQQFMRKLLELCDNSFPNAHSEVRGKIVKILRDEQEIHNDMLDEYTQTNKFSLAGFLWWVYSVNTTSKQLEEAIKTKKWGTFKRDIYS